MCPKEISIVRANPDDYREEIIRLWNQCLPGTLPARLEWLKINPSGPAIWFLAVNNKTDELVATTSVLPKTLYFNGTEIKGGIIGDIMVKEAFRRRCIASKLQRYALKELEEKMKFFYCVPNHNSRRLLYRAGLTKVYSLTDFLIPVKISYYLDRYKICPKSLTRVVDKFLIKRCDRNQIDDYEVTDLEEKLDPELAITLSFCKKNPNLLIGSRDLNFIRWKYALNPDGNYQMLKCKNSRGTIKGYSIFRIYNDKIFVYDLISPDPQDIKDMIRDLKDYAIKNECVGIYFYTVETNPYLKRLKLSALRIGSEMNLLCKGAILQAPVPWLFFPCDRNI